MNSNEKGIARGQSAQCERCFVAARGMGHCMRYILCFVGGSYIYGGRCMDCSLR